MLVRKPAGTQQGGLVIRAVARPVLSWSLISVILAAPVVAQERVWVLRDGTEIPLTRSSSELAVTYRTHEAAEGVGKRSGTAFRVGTVLDLPGLARSRTRLFRVDSQDPARRSVIRRNAEVESVRPVYRVSTSTEPLVSSGIINVRVRAGVTDVERAALWSSYRVEPVAGIDGLPTVYRVRPVDGEEEDEVLRAQVIARDARVVWAEPDFRIPAYRSQTTPVDPFFSEQWHLSNSGQSGGVADADIDAPEAWLVAEGQDVLFSMFDDACDVRHEDLRGGYIGTGHDPSLQSNDPGFTDPRPKLFGDFHGTSVMGLAVARANSLGGRGVAFLSRFTASRGLGEFLTNAQVASSYTFARQQEVDVHINSWGFGEGVPNPAVLEDAIETAFLEGRDLDGAEGPGVPRGMVVVFASGNGGNDGIGDENILGLELSTLPTVIGVGATSVSDTITSYSNFGPEVDVMAPGGDDQGDLMTTDVDDNAGYPDRGANEGGFNVLTGVPDLESSGLYTNLFSGTSAACPVVAGVAGLVLSVNPQLSATDVRLILEHTSDQVSPDDADYDSVTGRSRRYGYGRVNADRAVSAARDSLTNSNRTWPERVAEVRVDANSIFWRQNGDALEFRPVPDEGDDMTDTVVLRTVDDFLVLESDAVIDFRPVDGQCYDSRQLGCGSALITPLPAGIQVASVSCTPACNLLPSQECVAGAEHCVEFLQPAGVKHFALFSRNALGRYGFGVRVSSDGSISGEGSLPPNAETDGGTPGGGSGGGPAPTPGPKVTINVTPLEGVSPLTVRFMGNASTELPLDDSRTAWDFDIEDDITVDATTRTAQHTYVVAAGDRRTFMARLTMVDEAGNIGTAQTAIRVEGSASGGSSGSSSSDLRIVIGVPGSLGSDVGTGRSPFTVQLSVDTSGLMGTFQSVRWDLGDGTRATSLFVNHTFTNATQGELRLPISVTVTTLTPGGTTASFSASRTITVLPGSGSGSSGEPPPLDGTGAAQGQGGGVMCGPVGMIPALVLVVGLLPVRWVRRRGA